MKADAQVRQAKAVSTRNIHKDKSRTCHAKIASFVPSRSKKITLFPSIPWRLGGVEE
jgi:hypothetical protein